MADTLEMTFEQRQRLLRALLTVAVGSERLEIRTHAAGVEYTGIMASFLLENVISARCLLQLSDAYPREHFPVTIGFVIVRHMLEIEIGAHYIARDPVVRTERYLGYDSILKRRAMETCKRLVQSAPDTWQGRCGNLWSGKEEQVNRKYAEACALYGTDKRGRAREPRSWSGKNLRDMACEAGVLPHYDIFYSAFSSYTHGDVRLISHLMASDWSCVTPSAPAGGTDGTSVLANAAIVLSRFMDLFGEQFGVWGKADLRACWDRVGAATPEPPHHQTGDSQSRPLERP